MSASDAWDHREGSPALVLLLAAGEGVSELSQVLASAGVPLQVHTPGSPIPEATRVVLGPPALVAAVVAPEPELVGVAVVDPDVEVRAREGVDFLLRRPLDAEALPLLLDHLLNRPVRRRGDVGARLDAPVHVVAGWRRLAATLLDLSPSEARVRLERPLGEGSRVGLWLPRGLGGAQPRMLMGRAEACDSAGSGVHEVRIVFPRLSVGARERIRAVLEDEGACPGSALAAEGEGRSRADEAHAAAEGPSVPEALPSGPPPGDGSSGARAADPVGVPVAVRVSAAPAGAAESSQPASGLPAAGGEIVDPAREPGADARGELEHDALSLDPELEARRLAPDLDAAPLDPELEVAFFDPDHEPAGDERRNARRHDYRHRVIARGDQRPRVLLGRDLSSGGMRVDRDPSLEMGTELQVAVHVGSGGTPLVLTARVERDDGERGLFLRFRHVTPAQRASLDEMLDALPRLQNRSGEEVVLSRVLDERGAVA